ncbi:MAG: alpha amylase C-terminal domain-containing protein, partial [Coraliomargarita sp.]
PHDGYWQEIFNSDARDYGGLGYGNNGGLHAEAIAWDGRPFSLCLELPPHSTSVFRWRGEGV